MTLIRLLLWKQSDLGFWQVASVHNFRTFIITGFPQALEIMENLENHQKKFHAWKNHGICKNLNYPGKIMEFCEIIKP